MVGVIGGNNTRTRTSINYDLTSTYQHQIELIKFIVLCVISYSPEVYKWYISRYYNTVIYQKMSSNQIRLHNNVMVSTSDSQVLKRCRKPFR